MGANWQTDIKDKTDFEVYPREYAEMYYADDRKIIEDGEIILNKEEQGINPEGKSLWLLVTKIPLRDENGRLNGMLGITIDITQQIEAQEAIRKSQETLTLITNSIEDVIYSINGETGEFEYLSPAFEKKFGYTIEDISQMGGRWAFLNKIIVDEDHNTEDPITTEFRKRKVDQTPLWEHWWRCKDGSILYIEDRSTPTYKGNLLVRMDGILHDITEKKKMMEELIAAKERAVEMNRIKSNFLANMSHELRTPLVGLLGFSELLVEELDSKHQEFANMINQSGQRLLGTLNEILSYSEIEARKIEVFKQNTLLTNLIREEINLFVPLASKKGLYIREDLCDDFLIYTDPKLVRKIIDNLINNAVKFTRKGGITVSVSLQRDVIIRVSDTGIGIPKDKISVIFEEFRQASEGLGRNFEGTGLGLTIVKEFVGMLNGEIFTESELGAGTTFTVTLPYIKSPDVSEIFKEHAKLEDNTKHVEEFRGNKNILLVEDEELNAIAITKMLEKKFKLVHVSNAEDAISNAKAKKFDLILMDINLKQNMNGMEAVTHIRKIPGYSNIPIIAMTAFAMDKDKYEFLANGCSHYIAKPFTKRELLNLLGGIIEN